MDIPEPAPTLEALHNQYISTLKNEGFSDKEAETITKFRFDKWAHLREFNPDKLSSFMHTKNLTDENIYIYMIYLFARKNNSDKILNFQQLR